MGYSESSYKWYPKSSTTFPPQMIKYGSDGKTVLDPEDDAAAVNLGGKWRMPTETEVTELVNMCTWEWTSVNGVNGCKVTGPNGNSIFLPASGPFWGNWGSIGPLRWHPMTRPARPDWTSSRILQGNTTTNARSVSPSVP